jgi:hypothetical protein
MNILFISWSNISYSETHFNCLEWGFCFVLHSQDEERKESGKELIPDGLGIRLPDVKERFAALVWLWEIVVPVRRRPSIPLSTSPDNISRAFRYIYVLPAVVTSQ